MSVILQVDGLRCHYGGTAGWGQVTRYVSLKAFVAEILSKIALSWTEFRTDDGEKQALEEVPALKEWLSTLSSKEQKTSATRLLARIQSLPIEKKEDRADLFKYGILAFERLRMRHNLTVLDALSTFDSEQFRLIVDDVDQIEQSLYLEMIQERLGIINQLNNLKDKNALEVEIQRLVYDRLWLIDPSWERGTDALIMEETLGKTFARATALSPEEKKARLDIRYKRSADSHIIIELKRSERKDITYSKLYIQGRKYLTGLRNGLISETVKEPYIQIVFLLGSAPKQELPNDAEMFRSINARFLTYNQLVVNASVVYREYLEKKGKVDPLRRVLDALSAAHETPGSKKVAPIKKLVVSKNFAVAKKAPAKKVTVAKKVSVAKQIVRAAVSVQSLPPPAQRPVGKTLASVGKVRSPLPIKRRTR